MDSSDRKFYLKAANGYLRVKLAITKLTEWLQVSFEKITRLIRLHVLKFDEAKLWSKFHIVFIPASEMMEEESPTFSICNDAACFKLRIEYDHEDRYVKFSVQITAKNNLLFDINIRTIQLDECGSGTLINSGPNFNYICREWARPQDGPRNFELKVTLVNQTTNLPDKLFEDSEFTDFELQGEDGSVSVHKNVLAASSPVLRTMLLGEWRETHEGRVNLKSISKVSLEHFKDYLYKRKIPENALACSKLLPLAECYMMPDLQTDCALKISADFVPELAWEWFEYCIENKDHELLLTILENTDTRKIKALREYFSKTKDSK